MSSTCDPHPDVLVASAENDQTRMASSDINFSDFDFNGFMESGISTYFASDQLENSSWDSEHFQLPPETDAFAQPLYQNDVMQPFEISAGCALNLDIVQQSHLNDFNAQEDGIIDPRDTEVSQLTGFDPIKDIAPPPQVIGHENQVANLQVMTAGWNGPTRCGRLNCTSKAIFKTRGALATHTLNIHINPLVCSVPECSFKKPFGKKYELQRHIRTAHGNETPHKCPFEDCTLHISGFSRKDKLIKHMREKHTLMKCPYNHCSIEVPEVETELHLQKFHDGFECAIGSCQRGLKSRFRDDKGYKGEFFQHLRSCHNISFDAAITVLRKMVGTSDKTAHASYIPGKWQDCSLCR